MTIELPSWARLAANAYARPMADCAVIGCAEPVLEVWKPDTSEGAPRFHYLVCELHGLALRTGTGHTFAEGGALGLDPPAALLDWKLSRAGGHAIVTLVYGDGLETTTVTFRGEAAMLTPLGPALGSVQDGATQTEAQSP